MNVFEKIVLRNRIYNSSEIALRITDIGDKKIINSNNIVKYINDIYNESINSEVLENSQLYNEFVSVQNTEKDNKDFKIAYKINENLAVKITNHINVFRIADDSLVNKSRLIPWYCTESDIYSRYMVGRR